MWLWQSWTIIPGSNLWDLGLDMIAIAVLTHWCGLYVELYPRAWAS